VSILAQTSENFPYAAALFFAFAALTCVSAWAVVIAQNIVRMSVYLLLTLGGAAGLYFMLEAEFLAAIQLIVYAGGTLILIVFGVMLTSKNPFMQLKVPTWEVFLGVTVGLLLSFMLVFALVSTHVQQHPAIASGGGGGGDYYSVEQIGRGLLSTYLVPFEVAAVLLLVVMIAAAYMARKRVK
jgi:NADH:ubiquinone oxidoreductase subunit 6 (subunit J)